MDIDVQWSWHQPVTKVLSTRQDRGEHEDNDEIDDPAALARAALLDPILSKRLGRLFRSGSALCGSRLTRRADRACRCAPFDARGGHPSSRSSSHHGACGRGRQPSRTKRHGCHSPVRAPQW